MLTQIEKWFYGTKSHNIGCMSNQISLKFWRQFFKYKLFYEILAEAVSWHSLSLIHFMFHIFWPALRQINLTENRIECTLVYRNLYKHLSHYLNTKSFLSSRRRKPLSHFFLSYSKLRAEPFTHMQLSPVPFHPSGRQGDADGVKGN